MSLGKAMIYTGMLDRELQSQTIEWLRFPMTVGVVFIHSSGHSLGTGRGVWVYEYIRRVMSFTVPEICVPTFLFLSGYLFFYGMNEWSKSNYFIKVRKRIRSLIIPYVLWNFIAMLGGGHICGFVFL